MLHQGLRDRSSIGGSHPHIVGTLHVSYRLHRMAFPPPKRREMHQSLPWGLPHPHVLTAGATIVPPPNRARERRSTRARARRCQTHTRNSILTAVAPLAPAQKSARNRRNRETAACTRREMAPPAYDRPGRSRTSAHASSATTSHDASTRTRLTLTQATGGSRSIHDVLMMHSRRVVIIAALVARSYILNTHKSQPPNLWGSGGQ